MKKLLLLFITSILLLSGCGTLSANAVANPYEIKVGSKILSLYDDTKETFEENGFEVFEVPDNYTKCENNNISYRSYTESNDVCNISICSSDIITYKGISVGDNVKKLEQCFTKLQGEDDHTFQGAYIVSFNAEAEEIDSIKNLDENEKGVVLWYDTDDNSTITRIYIYDIKNMKTGI